MTKAIETVYDGYRFRSRLEARWAVFFDALGVEYGYEIEGFEFDGGLRYLPDFYIPRLDAWVEIKPSKPSRLEVLKAELLTVATEKRVYIFSGDVKAPTWEDIPYNAQAFSPELIPSCPIHDDGAPDSTGCPTNDDGSLLLPGCGQYPTISAGWDCYYTWGMCPECGHASIQFEGRVGRECGHGTHDEPRFDVPLLVQAYAAAQQKRFAGSW